jgi:dTDP-4-dehydrorhamnose reductase
MATSGYGFACAIVDGLRNRRTDPVAQSIIAISTREFPTKAMRPLNSRLEMGRLGTVLGIPMLD